MKNRSFPNTFVIISAVILICAVLTWVIPGGRYVTADDGSVSFVQVDSVPQTWQIFTALYNGFVKQAGIIIFILIVGGVFWLLNSTGAVSNGISLFITKVGKRDRLVLVCLAVLFSLGGAVFGMSEETIPFVGIVVPLVISMGYDAFLGMLVVYIASNVGFSSAFMNPFTVGVAQEMSGLPLFSGMGYRLLCWGFFTALLVVFVLVYTARHKNVEVSGIASGGAAPELSGRQKAVLWIMLATIVVLIVGVTVWEWYMAEISALFLVMGISCGVVAGFSANRIADEMIAGAKDIFSAAIVVGMASGIIVILQDANVIDSVLHSMQVHLSDTGKVGSISAMYGIQAVINLLIPSATAKAAITIPIMAPFCDLVGLSRQALVLAFQFGDGFTNMITPTSGVLLASLAMARIPYAEWVKRVWKIVLALIVLGFVFLLPAVLLDIPGYLI